MDQTYTDAGDQAILASIPLDAKLFPHVASKAHVNKERAANVEAESVQNAGREAPSAKLFVVFAVRIAWAQCYHATCTSTCGTAVA